MYRLFSRWREGFTAQGRLQRATSWLKQEGRAPQGFALLGRLAQDGMVAAQYQVARAYLEGCGVPRSPAEGVRWMHRAATAGHAEACFAMALMLLVDPPDGRGADGLLPACLPAGIECWPDPVAATGWAERAARLGLPDAQALYGYLLACGPESLRDEQAARFWCARAAQAGCPQGDLGLAVAHLAAQAPGTDPDAVAALNRAAESGLPTAQYMLGLLHERGWGMARDTGQAALWYGRAAGQGVRPAQARYGALLLQDREDAPRNMLMAETWLRRAALGGDREAAALLGDLHARGEAAIPADHEAVMWYRMAADQGHALACRMLAVLYQQGRGVAADPGLARQWLERAAAGGDVTAMSDLAATVLAAGGEQAATLPAVVDFEPAARAGDPVATFNLAVSLHAGVGRPVDRPAAALWMERAARAGVVNAAYWYGRMLLEGDGVAAAPAQARQWLEQAAMHGLPEAMFALGALYGGGHGLPPDREQALHWFVQAAQAGHALAQMMAGRYLARGLAGRVDGAQARHWLEQALAQGVDAARADYAQLAGG
ncbi:tetratricopeptide repeat protein [Komagataeibacter melomenusus]